MFTRFQAARFPLRPDHRRRASCGGDDRLPADPVAGIPGKPAWQLLVERQTARPVEAPQLHPSGTQRPLALVRERIARGYWTDGVGNGPPVAPDPRQQQAPNSGGLAAELRQLAELRDTGVLTDEQFEQAKQKLLS